MQSRLWLGLMLTGMWLAAAPLTTKQLMELPFEPVQKLPDFRIEKNGESREFSLPSLPVKPGKIRVLRGRFVSYARKSAGCNTAMRIEVNARPLGRYTAAGDERMLCKEPFYVFLSVYKGRQFGYFTGNQFCMPFAPTPDALDADSVGNNASMFLLDLEDVILGVDGNNLKFVNVRRQVGTTPITLIAQDVAVGYLDRAALPPPPGSEVRYAPVKRAVAKRGVRLEVGAAGGFAVLDAKGRAYLVESKLAMPFQAPFELLASDTAPKGAPKVTVEEEGKLGFVVNAAWKNGVALRRRLTVEDDGLLHWIDEWKNASAAIQGIPFHHRLRTAGFQKRAFLSGSGDVTHIASYESNPTVVLIDNSAKDGGGIGITEENDFARLIGSVKTSNTETEIFAAHFALAPKCSLTLVYTIDLFTEGGYWGFVNRLRRRWNIGAVTAPYAFFLVGPYMRTAPGRTQAEKIRNSFAHLGPIGVGVYPWRRFDHSVVRGNRYPKLPKGAKPAPGRTPDLDIDEFLKFSHRKDFDEAMRKEIALFRQEAPEAKYIGLTHPAMETVYLPLAHRWPYAENGIRTADGKLYHHPHYDRSHLGTWVDKDWAIAYYAPYAGSRYYDVLLDDVKQVFDNGADGIYIDEFSFGNHRDYSRYDYGRWDGFSADLDEKGNPVHLKYDVALASEGLQNAILSMAKERGKFFLGNGSAALRSVNTASAQRFWEGGNGMATLGYAHLDQVPMAFGNYGDTKTMKGIFNAVKDALAMACTYAPAAGQTLLKGRDNFVCKCFPLTVLELQPGRIVGKERIITLHSGTFAWPGAPEGAAVTLYRYDENGERLPEKGPAAVVKGGKITLTVPKAGLVIAELKQ